MPSKGLKESHLFTALVIGLGLLSADRKSILPAQDGYDRELRGRSKETNGQLFEDARTHVCCAFWPTERGWWWARGSSLQREACGTTHAFLKSGEDESSWRCHHGNSWEQQERLPFCTAGINWKRCLRYLFILGAGTGARHHIEEELDSCYQPASGETLVQKQGSQLATACFHSRRARGGSSRRTR